MTSSHAVPRMDFARVAPGVFRALLALDHAARAGLDPVLAELVQVRTAQINRCSYCLAYHTADALEAGESQERLDQLTSWSTSPLFTARERAALALTDAVTTLPDGVPDDVYDAAAGHFTDEQLAHLLGVIFTANAWNRLNVTARTV